jgi:hypothetical protein
VRRNPSAAGSFRLPRRRTVLLGSAIESDRPQSGLFG